MKPVMNLKLELPDKEKGLDTLPRNHVRNIKREVEDELEAPNPTWKKLKNLKQEDKEEDFNIVQNGCPENIKQEDEKEYDDERMGRELELRDLLSVNNMEEEDDEHTNRQDDEDDWVEENLTVEVPQLEDVVSTAEEIELEEEAEWIYESAFFTPMISPENLVRVAVREILPSDTGEAIKEITKVESRPVEKSTSEWIAEVDSIKDWILYVKAYKDMIKNMPKLGEFGPVADSKEDWDVEIADNANACAKMEANGALLLKSVEPVVKSTEELNGGIKTMEGWAAFLKSNREPVILPPYLKGKYVPIIESSEDWDAELRAIEEQTTLGSEPMVNSNRDAGILPPFLKEEFEPIMESEDWDAELKPSKEQPMVSSELVVTCTEDWEADTKPFEARDAEVEAGEKPTKKSNVDSAARPKEECDTEITVIEECCSEVAVTEVESNEDPDAEVIVTGVVFRYSGEQDGPRKRPRKSLMSVSPPTLETDEFDETAVNCKEEILRWSMIVKIRKALINMRKQQAVVSSTALHCKEHVESELNIDELWKVYLWDEKWHKLTKHDDNLVEPQLEDGTFSMW